LPFRIQFPILCVGIPFFCTVKNNISDVEETSLIEGLWGSLHSDTPDLQKEVSSYALKKLEKEDEPAFDTLENNQRRRIIFGLQFFP
jgi:hypothetical protein